MSLFAVFLNILTLVVINTALILFIDEIHDFRMLYPYDRDNPLEFHNALYF